MRQANRASPLDMRNNLASILFVLVQALCLLLVLAAPAAAGSRLSGTKEKA